MHPEIEQSKPGRCPICGMKLVLKSDRTSTSQAHHSIRDYAPLFIIAGLIFMTSLTIWFSSYNLSFYSLIEYFMIGFFITFAGFKLIDLPGFAEGYSTYDLLAKRWFGYGYLYPFIELFFGLAMIMSWQMDLVLWLEIIVMTFSGLGVALKLAKKEKFQCACLGTFLKVPLTNITLIEDFGMAALAAILLLAK